MKNLFVLFFVLTTTFLLSLMNSVHAQEATLVKQGQWGSGEYTDVISLNGHFYASTYSGQIDVIDQSKSGVASFIGQINLEENIFSMQVHNNRIVVATTNKLSIFDVSNAKALTLKYSVELNTRDPQGKLVVNDKVYFLADDNKIFVIQEEDNNYSIEQVIETTIASETSSREILLTDDYFYVVGQTTNEDNSKTTKIDKFSVADNSLVESVQSDAVDNFQKVVVAGMDRFFVTSGGNISLLTISDTKLNIATTFTPGSQYNYYEVTFSNNKLYLFSWNRQLYTYAISDTNQVSLTSRDPLYDFLSDISSFSQLKWSGDKLIALSANEGIIEFIFKNEAFSEIKYAYNQSGELKKGTFADNYYILPRTNRVDVIDISDYENITLHKQFQHNTDQITPHQDAYLLNGGYTIGLFELSAEQELIQQSSISLASHTELIDSVQSEKYIYSLDQVNGDIYLSRYNISTPQTLYETPIQIPVSGACCGFDTSMEIKDGKVLIHDSFLKGIHIFTDIENDNFSYEQFVDYPEGYFAAISSNDIIYILSEDKLTSYSFSSSNEFVSLNNVDLSLGTTYVELKVSGNYLFIQTQYELFLYELVDVEKPKYLANIQTNNQEFWGADFQFLDNVLIATTKQSMQFYQINKAPSPEVTEVLLDEDSALEGGLIFIDPEGDKMTFTINEQSTNGEASIDENGLNYTPSKDFNGEDSLTIKAQDVHGNFIEQTLSIVVEPVNDKPVASNDTFTVVQGAAHSGELLVTDIDKDSLTYNVASDVLHGSLTLSSNGEYDYTADATYAGTDSFSYSVTDGTSTVEGTINITVQAKPPETETKAETESSGGSINVFLLMILLWNISLRYVRSAVPK